MQVVLILKTLNRTSGLEPGETETIGFGWVMPGGSKTPDIVIPKGVWPVFGVLK